MLVAGNWKMYKTAAEAHETATHLVELLGNKIPHGHEVVLFAPFTALASTVAAVRTAPAITVGGQNMHPQDEGAFTGEIAPGMLLEAGCSWVLLGHSERRHLLGEGDEFIGEKVSSALRAGLNTVLCVGETLEEREAGQLEAVLARQLHGGLASVLRLVQCASLAIAYEPVWAIGTGKVASLDDISQAHGMIRTLLYQSYGESAAKTPILYGGSVKPDNTASIVQLDNVDGVLVGGASLQAGTFGEIVRIACHQNR